MEIEEFIQHIKHAHANCITRGNIIDHLSENTDNWILILKALLIKNPKRYIHKEYLLDKLSFMKRNPFHAHMFLDYTGLVIYKALKDEIKVKIIDLSKVIPK